jgi:hypothetical protein
MPPTRSGRAVTVRQVFGIEDPCRPGRGRPPRHDRGHDDRLRRPARAIRGRGSRTAWRPCPRTPAGRKADREAANLRELLGGETGGWRCASWRTGTTTSSDLGGPVAGRPGEADSGACRNTWTPSGRESRPSPAGRSRSFSCCASRRCKVRGRRTPPQELPQLNSPPLSSLLLPLTRPPAPPGLLGVQLQPGVRDNSRAIPRHRVSTR